MADICRSCGGVNQHNPGNKDCPMPKGFACACLPRNTIDLEPKDYEVRFEDGVAVRGPPS